MGGSGPPSPTSVQTPPEICANPLRSVLCKGEGVSCMYIVTCYCSPATTKILDPPTFFGLATPLFLICHWVTLFQIPPIAGMFADEARSLPPWRQLRVTPQNSWSMHVYCNLLLLTSNNKNFGPPPHFFWAGYTTVLNMPLGHTIPDTPNRRHVCWRSTQSSTMKATEGDTSELMVHHDSWKIRFWHTVKIVWKPLA